MWLNVISHFRDFQQGVSLTGDHHGDAQGKIERVATCLHNAYHAGIFNPANVIPVGSYGKNTSVHFASDIDLMYILPNSVLDRFRQNTGNIQSALLQEVRQHLLATFPRTEIKADGQVVVVDYQALKFEIVPTFLIQNQLVIADTNDGGRWKTVTPFAEIEQLNELDKLSHGSARALIKYLKSWKHENAVPLKSIVLEVAACAFIRQWPSLASSIQYNPLYWHDWLVRDFFAFFPRFDSVILPGSGERIFFGDGWQRKMQVALEAAQFACHWEYNDNPVNAEKNWQVIFGRYFKSAPAQEIQALGIGLRTLLTS